MPAAVVFNNGFVPFPREACLIILSTFSAQSGKCSSPKNVYAHVLMASNSSETCITVLIEPTFSCSASNTT